MSPKKYMAASVPRFIRQTRLGYLPLDCVIGSRLYKGEGDNNIVMDIIMLPVPQFQRMRTNVGLQHVAAPVPQPGSSGFQISYMLTDIKEVKVPVHEPDTEAYARNYFMLHFGLLNPEAPEI